MEEPNPLRTSHALLEEAPWHVGIKYIKIRHRKRETFFIHGATLTGRPREACWSDGTSRRSAVGRFIVGSRLLTGRSERPSGLSISQTIEVSTLTESRLL